MAISFSNRPLLSWFSLKTRVEKVKMIRNILIGYSYGSKIFLFKVSSFNQLPICLWVESENISGRLDCLYLMFKYENRDI